ncbi:MAG: 4-hydroxy-tetrahydrodipicolinate reductase [Planctomycetota bacterium]
MKTLKIAVNGAAGRMGRRVVAAVARDPSTALTAAWVASKEDVLGRDAGTLADVGPLGVPCTDRPGEIRDVEVVIDFSTPDGFDAAADYCGQNGVPLVVATTGLGGERLARIDRLAKEIPVILAPNTSVAVNVAMALTKKAAAALKTAVGEVDVEIVERHHRLKEDAPSGTALKFGEIVAGEMGQTEHVHGREGRVGPRSGAEIGYHALRVGGHVGEHTVVFGIPGDGGSGGEEVEVAVRSFSRDSYAIGAVAAAKFLADKPPGRYAMAEVLGLD